MVRKIALFSLSALIAFSGVNARAFERYSLFAGQIHQLDLAGDGQHKLSVISGEKGVELRGNWGSHYFEGLRELLVEDMNGDGYKEIIAVTEAANKLKYDIIGVLKDRLDVLDSLELDIPVGCSIKNTIIQHEDVNSNGLPEMVIIARDENDTISWYRILELVSGRWRELLTRLAYQENIIQLKVSKGRLMEKRAVSNEKGEFVALIKEYYTLSGTGQLDKVAREDVGYFYHEANNLEDIFRKVACEEEVPVEILKAIAATESNGKQFDYGEIKVSPDGGIGIMQVTPIKGEIHIDYLGKTYSGQFIERLKTDTYFNVKVGAQVLKDKWFSAFGKIPSAPPVGDGDPSVLENWYFALWAYNGYSLQNYPSDNWGRAYQERVIEKIPGFNMEAFSREHIIKHPVREDGLPDGRARYHLQGPVKKSFSVYKKKGDILKVRVEGSALRREPSTHYNNLGVLYSGTVLKVLGKIGETPQGYKWLKVKAVESPESGVVGKEGVVAALSLDRDYGEIKEGDRVKVLHRLILREEPFVPGNVMVRLQPGDRVKVLEKAGEKHGYKWLKIQIERCKWEEYKGRVGFIASFGLSRGYPDISPGEVFEVKAPANVRSSPQLAEERDYNVITRLGKGTPVIVLDGPTVNGRDGHLWYRVKTLEGDKRVGYISGSILEPFEDFFTDIEGHWAEGDINGAAAAGIMGESNDKRFYPNLPVTRRDFCIFVVKALGLETRQYQGYFTDIENGSAGALEVEAAYREGIIKGDGEGNFLPGDSITREEMAVIIYRALKRAGVSPGAALAKEFRDSHQISRWAQEGVSAVSALKIMTGREDGKFYPRDNTTRAESIVVLNRLLQYL